METLYHDDDPRVQDASGGLRLQEFWFGHEVGGAEGRSGVGVGGGGGARTDGTSLGHDDVDHGIDGRDVTRVELGVVERTIDVELKGTGCGEGVGDGVGEEPEEGEREDLVLQKVGDDRRERSILTVDVPGEVDGDKA